MNSPLLRQPSTYIAILFSAVVVLLYALVNFGASINMQGNTRDIPIAVVNADTGDRQTGLNLGLRAVTGLRTSAEMVRRTRLVLVPSREAAVKGLRSNQYWGALVIPADFTEDVLTAVSTAQPARLEILRNPAAGSAASLMAEKTLDAAAQEIIRQIGSEVLARTQATTSTVPVSLATVVAQPVEVVRTDAVTVGEHSGRGSSTFTLTFLAVLAGFMAANIVQAIFTDTLEQEAYLGHPVTKIHSYLLKLAVGFAAGLVSAGVIVSIAGAFHLDHSTSWFGLFGYVLLIEFVVLALTLMFYVLLGARGVVAAVLFNIVLFTALNGVNQPLQTLPRFLEGLANVLPFRYAADGARALLFYDGRLDAGLGNALLFLTAYLVGAVLVAVGVSALQERRAVSVTARAIPALPI